MCPACVPIALPGTRHPAKVKVCHRGLGQTKVALTRTSTKGALHPDRPSPSGLLKSTFIHRKLLFRVGGKPVTHEGKCPIHCPHPHLQTDLEDITDLIEMREEVSSLVIGAMKVAEEYQDSFERYSYLWVDDLQEFMKNFLIFGHAPTPEELDTRVDDTIPKTPPSLAQFQQQVCALKLCALSSPPCPLLHLPVDGLGASFETWVVCD